MNENEIIKPITLLKEDFIENLIELCNNSCLPLFVIEYILRDVHYEIKNLAKNQYKSDLAEYTRLINSKEQQNNNE